MVLFSQSKTYGCTKSDAVDTSKSRMGCSMVRLYYYYQPLKGHIYISLLTLVYHECSSDSDCFQRKALVCQYVSLWPQSSASRSGNGADRHLGFQLQ